MQRILALRKLAIDIKADRGNALKMLQKYVRKENGNISVQGIVGILIVAGLLVPIGIQFINDADTASWTAQQVLAWGAIASIAIVAIVLGILNKSGLSGGSD